MCRREYAETKDLGAPIPVDIFMWSVAPPAKPFLTKLGGTPHRESTRPWPTDNGRPYTFVAQFCFADSRDIVSESLPGDVILIFFKAASAFLEKDSVHIEWSSIQLESALTAAECPPPSFAVPQLSGQIFRTNEYPESWDVFDQAGHDRCYLFPTTQSTKIGRETFFIQDDPRDTDIELLCALNSVKPTTYPTPTKWPFVDLETLPDDGDKPNGNSARGKYQLMFADVGCMYFMIDKQGTVTWAWDCY